MMNYWDVLKASKGLYVADSYTMMWGRKISGDGQIYEITDIPPLTFVSNGTELIDYRISGNTIQDGTPTPDNPVEVVGCGEYDSELNGYKIPVTVSGVNCGYLVQGRIYINNGVLNTLDNTRVSTNLIPAKYGDVFLFSSEYDYYIIRPSGFFMYDQNEKCIGTAGAVNNTVNVNTPETKYIRLTFGNSKNSDVTPNDAWFMIVKNSTTITHYEPYHEPITTPVYIGSEPLHKIGDYADYVDYKRGVVVRRIKKLVLTGNENWTLETDNVNQFVCRVSSIANGAFFQNNSIGLYVCTHIVYSYPYPADNFNRLVIYKSGEGVIFLSFFKQDMNITSVSEFKSFLSAQYEAGTPITVWYVLAKPEEEPLENLSPIQTIKGTNILTVDTEVQPSEMYIKYKN